ncbi:hypothetical protein NN561_006586 [Cricetulus griseus]
MRTREGWDGVGVGTRAPAPPARLRGSSLCAASRAEGARGGDSGRSRGNPSPRVQPINVSDPCSPACGARPESGSRLTGAGRATGIGSPLFFHSALSDRRRFL